MENGGAILDIKSSYVKYVKYDKKSMPLMSTFIL